MGEFKDKLQQEAEEKTMFTGEVDKYFAGIDTKTSNGQLLYRAVGTHSMLTFIAPRLEEIEQNGELFGD